MKIDFGKYEEQIDIIPNVSIYVHCHSWDYDKDKKLWHFHFSIQWLLYWFEIQIGKD